MTKFETQAPNRPAGHRVSTRLLVTVGLAVCVLLAGVVSVFAATTPDGLEYVSGKLGFEHTATAHGTESSPFAGYEARGIEHGALSTGLSGVVGVLVVALIAFALVTALKSRTAKKD